MAGSCELACHQGPIKGHFIMTPLLGACIVVKLSSASCRYSKTRVRVCTVTTASWISYIALSESSPKSVSIVIVPVCKVSME
ncbi:unnamed protein product [Phytomonas sp. EM1]|nr:unnamed protein product [Phytomonas sp. EM1]|eukprot:CCW65232.1 unnamed protein product [Phytomonas sp. isolate EM1]